MEHPLHFTKGERIGILVLILICIGLFIAPSFLEDRSQTNQTDFSEFNQIIERWYADEEISETSKASSPTAGIQSPQYFDPNHASKAQLLSHSLPQNTIRAWLSYVKKGGRFDDKEAIAKFRALSSNDLQRISPFLEFSREQATIDHQLNEDLVDISYFKFDPHTITKDELLSLGLPERTAKNWTKYTANGGSFRKASDVQKVYGLSEKDFQRLLPYVEISTPLSDPIAFNNSPIPRAYESTNRIPVVIDINQATIEQWQELRGIGPAFSKRIVNFRDKLGGFYNINQVAETYGLPDSVFQKIRPSLQPSPLIKKLAINQLTEKELAAHPYLRYNDAKVIVQYRNNHGTFAAAVDLEKLYVLEAATIKKITPYLVFD